MGQMITIVDQETTEVQHRIRWSQMCLVCVHKTSTRADFTILSSLTPTSPVRRGCHTDNFLRDLGCCKRTLKRMLRAAQRGMLRVIIQTRKKIQNQEGNWRKRHSSRRNQRGDSKKSAHIMNATKTADFHSTTTKKKHNKP